MGHKRRWWDAMGCVSQRRGAPGRVDCSGDGVQVTGVAAGVLGTTETAGGDAGGHGSRWWGYGHATAYFVMREGAARIGRV